LLSQFHFSVQECSIPITNCTYIRAEGDLPAFVQPQNFAAHASHLFNGVRNQNGGSAAVDDLFHLQRGGRISKATAVVGSALSLKPMLYVDKLGGLSTDGTIRGRKRSLRNLVERMKATLTPDTDYTIPVGIVHGNCPEEAQEVANMINAETKFTNIIINDISPSIGVHAGPGAIGILYYGQEKQDAKQ